MTTTSQRRQRILQLLMEHGNVQVSELSPSFNVSAVTIRNDLSFFEEQGLVTRTYGGAFLKRPQHAPERAAAVARGVTAPGAARGERIGARAARLIRPGDNILIDAGTAAYRLARHLAAASGLTVMTNGLDIAAELAATEGIRLLCTGGMLDREARSFVGTQAEQGLDGYHFDKVFLDADGFDLKHGITAHDEATARLKRRMIEAAGTCIVLLDSAKCGQIGLHRIAPLSRVGAVIADPDLPAEYREALERLEIDIAVAD
ncbi:MAG TPA: transcriptional repressor AgaR [Paucimonas sp.]|nr:transcriptional repressor AgaR [Paucimonas sp.]